MQFLFFFFAVSSCREEGGEEPALILAFNFVDPPMPHDKLPIGHDSRFSHKNFSPIIHGLIALHVRFGEAGDIWQEGLRYHVTSYARLLGYCIYIWDITQAPLRISAASCVCCNRSDVETESPWVPVPLPFFFAVVLCMVGLK